MSEQGALILFLPFFPFLIMKKKENTHTHTQTKIHTKKHIIIIIIDDFQ